MSRNIKNDHPFDEDEVKYLLSRSGGAELVAANKEEYPPGSEPDAGPDDEELELSQKVYDHVKGLSADQLQTELAKAKLSTKGDESDLKVRLAQHLQELENKKK